jgi:hypothetical protein
MLKGEGDAYDAYQDERLGAVGGRCELGGVWRELVFEGRKGRGVVDIEV